LQDGHYHIISYHIISSIMATPIPYYIHNGQKYITSFPTSLFPLKPNTGPQKCLNCQVYGIIDEVFIGFCANCHHFEYDDKYGSLTDVNVETQCEITHFPELFIPNYITESKYAAISDLFTALIIRFEKLEMSNKVQSTGPCAEHAGEESESDDEDTEDEDDDYDDPYAVQMREQQAAIQEEMEKKYTLDPATE